MISDSSGQETDFSHSLTVSTNDDHTVLAFDEVRECRRWLLLLRRAVVDLQVWRAACEEKMHIPEMMKKRPSYQPEVCSFYDQIKIGELKGLLKADFSFILSDLAL